MKKINFYFSMYAEHNLIKHFEKNRKTKTSMNLKLF